MKQPNLDIPPAPWTLHGTALSILHRDASGKIGAKVLVQYVDSPVGAYNEMAFATLTFRGPTVLEMPVTLERSMIGGRTIWGFPKTLEEIEYSQGDNRVRVRHRGGTVRARISRFSFPLKLRSWTIQTLNGAGVRVPIAIRGRVHFAWHGLKLGVFLREFELVVAPPERI